MKAILSIGLFCLVVAAVTAKPSFNKDCFENRPKVRPVECCTGATLIDEAALAACKAKYPEPTPAATESTDKDGEKGGRRRHHRGGSCILECYFNQTGIYKNGDLVKSAALAVLGKSLDAPMNKVLSTSLDTCVASQEAFKKAFESGRKGNASGGPPSSRRGDRNGKGDDKSPRCRFEGMFLLRCVEGELFKNCPADKKVQSEECSALTTYMDKCKFEKKP